MKRLSLPLKKSEKFLGHELSKPRGISG